MTMYNPQRLHPISYVTGLIDVIKQNFIVIILFLFNIRNFKFDDFGSYIWPGVMTLIFLVSFIHNIIKVYNTRYWIENNHFILTTGVFNKERKELNISRIQSADTTQSEFRHYNQVEVAWRLMKQRLKIYAILKRSIALS